MASGNRGYFDLSKLEKLSCCYNNQQLSLFFMCFNKPCSQCDSESACSVDPITEDNEQIHLWFNYTTLAFSSSVMSKCLLWKRLIWGWFVPPHWENVLGTDLRSSYLQFTEKWPELSSDGFWCKKVSLEFGVLVVLGLIISRKRNMRDINIIVYIIVLTLSYMWKSCYMDCDLFTAVSSSPTTL